MASLLVGIDGGQSALRLRTSATTRVGVADGFRHGGDDVDDTASAVRRAAVAAGLTGPVDVVCLGLSGLPDGAGAMRALAVAVADVLDAAEVRICADMVTSHAGALPDGFGVVVAVGTGAVCLALDHDGTAHRVDGWGHLFGDDGSAFAVGRAGLAAVQRHRDGRGAATALTTAARTRFGEHVDTGPWRLYRSATVVADVAGFAVDVYACASAGDAVARRIVERAADDLADSVAAAVAAISGDGPVPVAHTGGVLAPGGFAVDLLRDRLADRTPRADLRPAAGSALAGALRLAGDTGPYGALLTVAHRGAR
ncbi:BadF/BadG/BcrA/BcrD ATPase family protein [Virgisporangium aurantiacum]|uniref:ATPase BadF/BadG/BcrA/BcrD type domain-containing protein n=1 Tax=Virgisporangium aurantiacum TaxID=175570 RepID=A0A8J3Z3L4_9ACTN|nr:BadF/BadG/BcrA/BcrD ATPase family protein [Virgisporangium aurantiacum]GIJ56881.1 hypothetical protein Vau01_043970 [Virgisporangium aurantiacum]